VTEEEFTKAVGRPPEDDDLDRANCKEVGDIGHIGCGVCEHGRPVFTCPPCFVAAVERGFRRTVNKENV